ncbi:stage V sporulation protein D [Saliterribacillus persicus]|uniref:serine-type D-Ala-D-Ala carboxypeptidase n=1 Tax=Saliterribacillus persicus TaxID=930114 RepID=A0A368XSF6_9BACI|nr:stage V sporulation protein D [Saliterribacillus persicus]RCW70805.1 stage V sporulation protein D (sporulation-specific penicillin-binding protein) [Saliterribacillus persicus]
MRVSFMFVKKRIITVFFVFFIIACVITIRLGYVQFFLGDFLSSKALDSWSRDIVFEPNRGKIIDRNGEILAENISAPSVMVVPRQIKDSDQVAKSLASILEMEEKAVLEQITKNESIVRLHPQGRKISDQKATAIQLQNHEGVYIAGDFKRHYPYGEFLSHVIGFSGIDNQGLTGLEVFYDDFLSGKKGSLSFVADAKGKKILNNPDHYKAPIDGGTLQLTIDARVQTIIERELDEAEALYAPDGALGIAVNPNTGEILGMASRPSFDPENYREVEPQIYNRNLPIWSTYEPGSTFKIITLAAALEEGLVDLHEDEYIDDGDINVNGTTLHCWKRGGHGHQTYLEVVQNSCNPGFVQLGSIVGKEKLFSYIDNFGFGKKTGIDIQGESNGILFQLDNVGPVELATTSFGQGVSVTPIQQVMAVSAAVNGGYLYQPYIAKSLEKNEDNVQKEENKPILKQQVISKETSLKVRNALEHVVAKGTGRSAFVEGYRVGGKTGTAQKVGKNGRYMENNHIVSFIGFAPADNPEIVVYIAVDNPKNTVQFGGVVAAPIVGNIIEDSLRVLGVEKSKKGLEKDYQWPEEALVEAPDLIGMNTKKLQKYLYTFDLEVVGEGNTVIEQAPSPGERIAPDSKIRILVK